MSKLFTILNVGTELDALLARQDDIGTPTVMWSPATGIPHAYTDELRAWRLQHTSAGKQQ